MTLVECTVDGRIEVRKLCANCRGSGTEVKAVHVEGIIFDIEPGLYPVEQLCSQCYGFGVIPKESDTAHTKIQIIREIA